MPELKLHISRVYVTIAASDLPYLSLFASTTNSYRRVTATATPAIVWFTVALARTYVTKHTMIVNENELLSIIVGKWCYINVKVLFFTRKKYLKNENFRRLFPPFSIFKKKLRIDCRMFDTIWCLASSYIFWHYSLSFIFVTSPREWFKILKLDIRSPVFLA